MLAVGVLLVVGMFGREVLAGMELSSAAVVFGGGAGRRGVCEEGDMFQRRKREVLEVTASCFMAGEVRTG